MSDIVFQEVVVHREGDVEVRWSFRYVAWVIYWHGRPYGGCFLSRGASEDVNPEAIALAHELAAHPPEIQQGWRLHGHDPADAMDQVRQRDEV